MSKVATKWIADAAVTKEKLASSALGNGLTGGSGIVASVDPDTTGGAGLAEVVNVSANGVAIKVDESTVEENGGVLRVVPDGISATEIDETDSFTWSGTHDLQTGTTHVATPSADTHATTKAYVDAAIEGMTPKGNAMALATANLALTGDPGAVDGVTLATGDIILLTGQTDPIENGLWVVDTTGAWARPDNFGTGAHAEGSHVMIRQGTTYGDGTWWCTTNAPSDVVDTHSLAWSQYSAPSSVSPGTGLTKIGNIFHVGDGATEDRGGIRFSADDIAVKCDDSTTEISAHKVIVKALGVNTGQLAAAAVDENKLATSTAGDGISGGGGSAYDLDINGIATAETVTDDADLIAVYDDSATALRKMTRANFLAGAITVPIVEMHKITSGEVTAGYFTLGQTPTVVTRVTCFVVGGLDQVSKQNVGATGVTPDFDILSTNQCHFNNNGAASGLSEDLAADDVVEIRYDYTP